MGDIGDDLRRRRAKLQAEQRKALAAAGRLVKQQAMGQLRSDAGGDARLSGLRNGTPQRIVVKTHVTGRLTEVYVIAGPKFQRAPWFWLEFGTAPGPRPHRRKSRQDTRLGEVIRGAARGGSHRGTPAKRTWSIGVSRAEPKVRTEIERRIDGTFS